MRRRNRTDHRHLLAQRGVWLDLIVVDDRSTDRTSEILRQLAKEDARVQVKRVEVLPEGWLASVTPVISAPVQQQESGSSYGCGLLVEA